MNLSEDTVAKIDAEVAKFPERRSAMMNVLHLVQEELGYVPDEGHPWIAEKLGVKPVHVMEVVTFYPMYRREPAGKVHVVICRTLSCALCGGYAVKDKLAEALGAPLGGVSEDGKFSLDFGECLGSCGTGPVVHANGALFENVDPANLDPLVEKLHAMAEGAEPVEVPAFGTPEYFG
ncbi:MAG: NAD(P)H-dependent oxidoreductase subunit E [Opitutales bacterium]